MTERQDRFSYAGILESTVVKPQYAVARSREPRIVGGDDRRQMITLVHLAQEPVQRIGRQLVEIAGRLVGQEHARPHDQRPGNRHALLLAARQHPGAMRQPLAEPDAPEQLLRPAARVGQRDAGDAHRHLGVLERAELGQQVVELKHEPDVPVPERDDGWTRQRRQVRVADHDRACVRAIQPAEHVQERALADSRRADNRHHLAGLDHQVEIAKNQQFPAADRISFSDAAGLRGSAIGRRR